MRKTFGFSAAILLCVFLCGCGLFPSSSDWRQCRFQVSSIRFEGLRENQAEWQVVLAVDNPTSKQLRMEGIHLFAALQTDTLATLSNSQPVVLAPHDTTLIPLELELPPDVWNRAMRRFRQEGKGQITVTGDVTVHTYFGVKKISNAFKRTYDVDLASLMGSMGSDLIRNLFFRH